MMLGHGAPDWGVVAIFVTVYLGMILGGLPRLKLDRSGVALLGAIGVIGLGVMSTGQAAQAVDWPTILLLFSFMVLSAQMRLGGFYTTVTHRVAALPLGRSGLLAALIAVAAALSAVFGHDPGGGAPVPAAASGPGAVFAGPGLRRQYRLRRDADRQPTKHVDRLGAAAAVRRLRAPGLAARTHEPGGAVGLVGVGAAGSGGKFAPAEVAP